MRKTILVMLAIALVPACLFAVDGVVLINQSTVMAAGGFPYIISKPGSYRLSDNLQVPNNVDGIQIAASTVTLDLNGFNITRVAGTVPLSVSLVKTVGAVRGVTLRNGTISSLSSPDEEDLINTSDAIGTVFEDLTLIAADGRATAHFGTSAIVRRVWFTNTIVVICPAVVVDSLADHFRKITISSTACTFGFVSGDVI